MRAAHDAVYAKVFEANAAIVEANAEIATLNEMREEARGFAEDIGREIDDYMSDRSDAWQESDRANAYAEWRDAWQNWSPGPISDFEELADVEADAIDEFDELPNEPDA